MARASDAFAAPRSSVNKLLRSTKRGGRLASTSGVGVSKPARPGSFNARVALMASRMKRPEGVVTLPDDSFMTSFSAMNFDTSIVGKWATSRNTECWNWTSCTGRVI